MTPDTKLTVHEHIQELRSYLIKVAVVFGVVSIVAYVYHAQLAAFLIRPLHQNLVYTSPAGGLEFIFMICLLAGFLAAIPMATYYFLKFVEPVLKKPTRRMYVGVVSVSAALLLSGAAFAYAISLPAALNFLTNFSSDQIQPLITTDRYLSFVIVYIAGFAFLFQLPLIIWIIDKSRPLSVQTMLRSQRVVILVSFVVAALLTPTPDPFNMIIMAVPIIGLYQIGIFVVWRSSRRRNQPSY